jgi:hypothetical protein
MGNLRIWDPGKKHPGSGKTGKIGKAPFPRLELSNPIMAGSRDPILLKSNRTYLIGNLLRPL